MTVLGHISGPFRYPLRQEPATLAQTAIEALATALQHAPSPPASPTAAHNCLHGHQQQEEEEDEDDDDHHRTAAVVLSSLPVELAQQLLTALLALPVRRSSSSRAGCGRVCYVEALLLRPDLISLSLRHAADPSPPLPPASSASSSSSDGQQQQQGRGAAVVLERVLASVWACCPRLGLVDLGEGCSPQLYLPLLQGLTASSSDLVASSLHTLCLAGCLELDDGLALHALAGAGQLQQLSSLDVSGCVQLSDEAVAGLLHAHGPRLRTLLLACLPRLTGRAWACLTGPPLPRLQWLSLRCCAGLTAPSPPTSDTAAAAAACCWPELLGLDVTGVLGLGDAALLPLLLPRARALQALVLGETRLSEQGLQALLLLHDAPPSRHQQQPQGRDSSSHRPPPAAPAMELRELDLSWAETLAWSSGPDQQQEPPLLSVLLPRCPHLTSLSLQCCQLEGGLLPLLTHLPALTSLNLNRARMPLMASSHPTEEDQPPPPPGSGAARGGSASVCWPRLTWLDLSWCAQPSTAQELLQLVRRHCPALQHLALQGFKEALRPADTFSRLLLDAPPSLRFLDCSWCDEVDGELARRASKRRPRVVVVDYYCSAWVGGRCLGDMGDPETKEALAGIQL